MQVLRVSGSLSSLQYQSLFSEKRECLFAKRQTVLLLAKLSVKMTKYVDFTWVVPVPQELLDGTVADKWIEEKDSADLEHEATFRWGFLIITGPAVLNVCISDRVDQYGFFIYWKSEGREGDVKELSQVNDIRGGELPKVCKLNHIWSSELRYIFRPYLSGPSATDHSQTETRRQLP